MRANISRLARAVRRSYAPAMSRPLWQRWVDRASRRLARAQLAREVRLVLGPGAQLDAARVSWQRGCALEVGEASIVEAQIDLEKDGAALVVGRNCYVGASIFKVAERIEVGDDVEIAWNCSIVDHDWEPLAFEHRRSDKRTWYSAPKRWEHVAVKPVRIGAKALVGFNATILKGVTIGEGAVVGVGSVVTRDVAPWTVVAGVPAKVIRRLEPR